MICDTAIISDAFSDEKDRLALMEDFGVETLGKHVAEALLEALESVPLIGNLVRSAEQRVAFYRFRVLHNHHMKQLALLADANQDNNVSPEEIAQSLDKDANGEVRGASPCAGATPARVPGRDRWGVCSTIQRGR